MNTMPYPIEAFVAALGQLPPLRRTVYLLAARDGLTYAEIAERLAIEIEQVPRVLAEALVDLMTILEPTRH